MTPLQGYTTRVLHRWRVIVAVAVLGAVLSAVWTIGTATTAWTATAALTTQSQNRGPDQDAVLALGYVDYFNQPTYQDLLRTEVTIPDGVKLTAKTGATSPILYIEAAGTAEDAVRTAAGVAADRFRNDVRDSLLAERAESSADLQRQIADYVTSLQKPGRTQAEGNVILDQVRSLQGRLTDLQADNTNLLKPLQPTPGVAGSNPDTVTGIATGAAGGLVLGVLVALLLVVLDNRLRTPADVRQRLGLATVAEFDGRTTHADRLRRIENLANGLNLVTRGTPVVIAVVAPHPSTAATAFARELAATGVSRRSGTVLVLADLRTADDRRGLADVLDGRAKVSSAAVIASDGLAELPPGHARGREPYAVFEPDRLVAAVHEASAAYGLVVIDVPPILDASESQVICRVADHVLVVVDRGVTRWAEARRACTLLADVRARVSGVVLDDPRRRAAAPTDVDNSVDDSQADAETELLPHIAPLDPVQGNGNGAGTNGAGTNGSGTNGSGTNGSGNGGQASPTKGPGTAGSGSPVKRRAARRSGPKGGAANGSGVNGGGGAGTGGAGSGGAGTGGGATRTGPALVVTAESSDPQATSVPRPRPQLGRLPLDGRTERAGE